mgnify:CR=1 FL=1
MHVREKSLNKITDSNTVSTEEMIAFLEHLDQCDFCLDQMIEEEIRNTDQPAPDYLAEQILNRAAAPDVQAAKAVRTTSRKMQLFYYGLRTATGMIAALFLLFVIQQADLSTFSGVLFRNPANLPSAQKSALTRKHFHGCHRIFLQSFHAALIN